MVILEIEKSLQKKTFMKIIKKNIIKILDMKNQKYILEKITEIPERKIFNLSFNNSLLSYKTPRKSIHEDFIF